MQTLSPHQSYALMALGMLVTAIPALWIKHGALAIPCSLPLDALLSWEQSGQGVIFYPEISPSKFR